MAYSLRELTKAVLLWPKGEVLWFKNTEDGNWICDISQEDIDRNRNTVTNFSTNQPFYKEFYEKGVPDNRWLKKRFADGDASQLQIQINSFRVKAMEGWQNQFSPPGVFRGYVTNVFCLVSTAYMINLIIGLPGWDSTFGEENFTSVKPNGIDGTRVLIAITKLLMTLRPPGFTDKRPDRQWDERDPWMYITERLTTPLDLVQLLVTHRPNEEVEHWSGNSLAQNIILLHLFPDIFAKLTARLSSSTDTPDAAIDGHLELLRFATVSNHVVDVTGLETNPKLSSWWPYKPRPYWWPYDARPILNKWYAARIKERPGMQNTLDKVFEFLKEVQRVTILIGQWTYFFVPFMEQGITSALLLSSMSESEVRQAVKNSLFFRLAPPDDGWDWESALKDIFKRATSITSRNQHAYVEIVQFLRGTGMKAIDGEAEALDRQQALSKALQAYATFSTEGAGNSIDELVGVIDRYNVEEAYTVHSPSAYLCELLDSLPRSARAHLFSRRPDIGNLLLTEANTSTTLPYLDLAIETMESYLVYFQDITRLPVDEAIKNYDTNANDETQDLAAEPHNAVMDLYSLSGICNRPAAPFSASPLDIGIEETRRLLKALKVSRYELLTKFSDEGRFATAEEASSEDKETAIRRKTNSIAIQRAIAAEYLNLSPADYAAITKETFVPPQYWEEVFDELESDGGAKHDDPVFETFMEAQKHSFQTESLWGYNSFDSMVRLQSEKRQDSEPESTDVKGLGHLVERFLPVSGLTVQEWLLLTNTRSIGYLFEPYWVDDKTIRMPDSPQYRIRFKDGVSNKWNQIQAFLRLRAKSGLSIPELDVTMTVLSGFDKRQKRFKPEFLSQLADIKKIQSLVDVNLLDLLSFWGPITPTVEEVLIDPSKDYAYKRLFLTRKVQRVDGAFHRLAINRMTDSAKSFYSIDTYQLAIATSLGATQAEMAAIRRASKEMQYRFEDALIPGLKSDDSLSFVNIWNLSVLLRCITLMRAANITANDLLDFLIVFREVFDSPSATLEALSFWKSVSDKGMTIKKLRFVLDGHHDDSVAIGATDAELLESAANLSSALLQSGTDFVNADTGQSNTLQQTLSLASSVFKRDDVKRIDSFLKGLLPGEETTSVVDMIQNVMLEVYGSPANLDKSFRTLLEADLAGLDAAKREQLLAQKTDRLHDWLAQSVHASRQQLAVKTAVTKATKVTDAGLTIHVLQNLIQARLPENDKGSDTVKGDQALLTTFGKLQRDTSKPWTGYLLVPADGELFFVTSDPRIIQDTASAEVKIIVNGVLYEWAEVKKDLYIAGGIVPLKDQLLDITLPTGDIKYKYGSSAISSIPASSLVSKSSFTVFKETISQVLQHTTIFSALAITTPEIAVVYSSWRSGVQNGHFDKSWIKTLITYSHIRDTMPVNTNTTTNVVVDLIKWISQSNRWKDTPKENIPSALKGEAAKWAASRSRLPLLSESIAGIMGCPNVALDPVLSVACQSRDPEDILEKLLYNHSCMFRLFEMVSVLVKFGLSGASAREVFSWAEPYGYHHNMDSNQSQDVAASIKKQIRMAITNDDEWNKTITPINDELRVLRRDALIYALLRCPKIIEAGVRDPNGLFDFFWIDTQMSPALKTSRIKQATSIVQTFTSRCLMELEKDPSTEEVFGIDQEQWQWLQKYRVWEANRRVYLTPETWLSMSTLDLKSEIFVAFENSLSQGVIDWDAASTSVAQYVTNLCDISDLHYITQHLEQHGNNQFTLHIFARTANIPATFYYRTRHSQQGWSPWTRMDLDIMTYDSNGRSGQYLVPWSSNGRLFLFLPEFKAKMKSAKPVDMSKARDTSNKEVPASVLGIDAVEITIAWSEYRNGAWSQKTVFPKPYLDSWTEHAIREYKLVSFINLLTTPVSNWPLPEDASILHTYQFNQAEEARGTLTITVVRATAPWDSSRVFPTKPANTDQNTWDNFLGQFRAPPKWFKPCEIRISLSQLYCDILSLREFWIVPKGTEGSPNGLEDNPDTTFGETADQGILWTKKLTGELAPTLKNGTIRNNSLNEPYTSTLLIQDREEDLYNDEAHMLMETVSVGTPMRSQEILSTTAADFGRKYSSKGEYNVRGTAYGQYGWELGFFVPMLLAERFLTSRRFDLALKAISLVFDPLTKPQYSRNVDISGAFKTPDRQWLFQPFRRLTSLENTADSIIMALGDQDARPSADEDLGPFNPHAVCRSRILGYMKWTVIRFVEILAEWGDAKFREDTLETLPEAILLYTQASNIIGPRLQLFDRPAQRSPQPYKGLTTSGFVTEFESVFPWDPSSAGDDIKKPWLAGRTMSTEHFAIPADSKLMDLRDLIDDRLFKIRNSMDIKGMVRTLALYEPRIDPGKLIRATAGGSYNLANTLNDLNVPLVNVRFNRLVSKALSICFDLRQFGRTYMEIIKNKDDQALATLLASQDTILNKMRQEIAEMAVVTATSTMKSMNTSRELVEAKMKHLFGLVGLKNKEPPKYGESFTPVDNDPPKMLGDDAPHTIEEETWMAYQIEAAAFGGLNMGMKFVAGYYSMIPEITANVQFMGIGPSAPTPALKEFAGYLGDAFAQAGDIASGIGEMQLKTGEWKDRLRERKLEINELGGELVMLDQELQIQEVLVASAQKEAAKLERELEWNTFIADWQRATRTTNDSFYTWLQAEFHGIYYQTYNFAYDMAKKAEQALIMELGLPSMDSIIDYGCWDVSRNGLLAGEKLYNGLRKLEQAFSETRAYDFEITKRVSIKDLDQTAYTNFTRTTPHVLEFWLPEQLFDLDFPGHYKRRIRTVSIGFAADGREISAELTLLQHKYRVTAKDTDSKQYPEKMTSNVRPDLRFRQEGIPINAIGVTVGTKSTVQWVFNVPAESANGLFELNFGGDSYLPFEGAGVISKWRLELSPFTEVDPIAISDMVMTIQYTSSRGSESFKKAATEYIREYIKTVPALRPALGSNRPVRLPAA